MRFYAVGATVALLFLIQTAAGQDADVEVWFLLWIFFFFGKILFILFSGLIINGAFNMEAKHKK